jgi:hypothetical protein
LAAVDVVVLVTLVIAGRVFPTFTRNATGVASIRSLPALDALTLASMLLFTIADTFLVDPRIGACLAAAAGVFAAARSIHWGARHSLRNPLLWVLHVGYAWIPIGLALRAVSAFDGRVPPVLGTHALTIGAIGGLTLGMMSRVALGHSGRPLALPRPMSYAFAAVTLAAITRVFGPLVEVAWYQTTVFASVVALMVGEARSIPAQNLSFQKLAEIPIGLGFTGPGVVATGDFNGDGKMDLAVANSSSVTVSATPVPVLRTFSAFAPVSMRIPAFLKTRSSSFEISSSSTGTTRGSISRTVTFVPKR